MSEMKRNREKDRLHTTEKKRKQDDLQRLWKGGNLTDKLQRVWKVETEMIS